jgi:hypothetical protein
MQTRYMGMFKGASDLMADFRKDQIATQGKLADFVLSHVKPGEELTPGAGLTVLKMAQAAHIATTDDVNKYMAAMQQGQKPEDLYKAIKQYSMGGQVAKPPSNESELAYRAAQGDPVAIDAMNRAHPQKPPEPAKGFTNETELRQDAATQGTSAETPTAWQSVETLRQMDEAKAKAPAAGKSLQQKTVMLDGKRKEVLFDPDPNATQKVFDLDGKPITNAAQRISGLPTAAEQRPEAGTQPEIEIKPGTRMYRVAQDIAYGTLTMSDFNRIYGRAMGNAATKAAIYDTARLLNPDFSPAKFELDYKMAANPQIRQRIVAIDGLGPIIEKIKEISSKVGNGDVQAFNRLLQGAKLQVSNKTVANFQQLKTLLGDEAGLALGVGTGSDLKTKLGLDLVNTNLSDGSFQSNMDQLDSILGARKGLLLKQMGTYASAAGGNAPPTAPAPTGLPPVPVGMIRAFDPSGQPHLAKQGTPLPAGWTLAQ